jgi:hypothetical protein
VRLLEQSNHRVGDDRPDLVGLVRVLTSASHGPQRHGLEGSARVGRSRLSGLRVGLLGMLLGGAACLSLAFFA